MVKTFSFIFIDTSEYYSLCFLLRLLSSLSLPESYFKLDYFYVKANRCTASYIFRVAILQRKSINDKQNEKPKRSSSVCKYNIVIGLLLF